MSREIELCAHLLEGFRGVMYDVGAMRGGSSQRFYHQGWEVHAFEPDPGHAMALRGTGVIVNQVAVMEYSARKAMYFTSPESQGIGTLTPWLDSHTHAGVVKVISLKDYILDQCNPLPDFLKVDAEGHDLDVLKGYPWMHGRPKVVMCEYDHRKEDNNLEIMDMLDKLGYTLIRSEYAPVQKYGQPHRFIRYQGARNAPSVPLGWGNIIGIR